MWLICSCWTACCHNTSGTTIHLPFIMTPSMTALSSLSAQYGLMSCCIWSLCSGQPFMIYSWDTACLCLGKSLVAAHALSYILVCCSLSVWHWYLTACLVFLHLCLQCGFVWIASLLWINLVQACIWFSLCIDVFLAEFAVVSVIILLCLFLILQLVVCAL